MEVRPKLIHPIIIKCLNNEWFLWGALGIPKNQAKMIYDEGTLYEYVIDAFDPVFHKTLLHNDNYFYYMCMQLHYTKDSCPTYVTQEAYDYYTKNGALDCIRIHTDKIINGDVVA
jgi:betaine lipid synthase